MKKFIHEENLKLFRKQLAETTDPKRRQVLLKLLADEEMKAEEEVGDDEQTAHQGKPSGARRPYQF